MQSREFVLDALRNSRVRKHDVPFAALVGCTFLLVEQHREPEPCILFFDLGGEVYMQFHIQDCCESVDVESIVGDLSDLEGAPILMAEESVSDASGTDATGFDSGTWSFYKLATRKGYVDIRWLGTSNGYYSESVNLCKLEFL